MDDQKLLPDVDGLDELRRERDVLDSELKALNTRLESLTGKRIQSFAPNEKKEPDLNLNESQDAGRQARGFKRDRSDSSIHSSGSSDSQVRKSPRSPKPRPKLSSVLVQPYDFKREQEEEAKRKEAILESQRSDKRVLDRNKRMFGMLNAQLQRFKKEEIVREKSTVKRSKIEEKLDMAVEVERANNVKEVDEILKTKRRKVELLDKVEARLDIVGQFKNWESTNKHLCNFIRTETKPKLFWLPKEHNLITERRLKDTRDYFNLCLAERTLKFKKDMNALSPREADSKDELMVNNRDDTT